MSRDEPSLNLSTADETVEVWACGSNLYQQLSDDASILEIREPVRMFADQTIARIVGISSTQILAACTDGRYVHRGFPLVTDMAVDRSSRDGRHVWLLAMLADRQVLRMLGKDNFTAGLCLAKDGSSSSALFELAAPYRTVSLIEGLHKIGDAVMDKHGKLAVAVQGASNDITDVRLYQHLEGFLTQSTAHVCVTLQTNAFHYHNARLYSGAAHFTLCGDSSFPVQAFGDNRHFQQGHSAGVRHSGASKVVARSVSVFEGIQSDNGESPIRKIACGDLHTACLAGDGALYMAGSGKFNQCGGFSGSEATLVQFQDDAGNEDADIDVLDVACGSNHTVLLTSKGVMSAGSNHAGQLCCGTDDDVQCFRPTLWSKLSGKIVGVHAAGWMTLVTVKTG